ncbi:hypothetical protein E5S67_04360 [Microcoleus sp. IPMA8]|uniref:Secreted protein n=1 Tax=Microcoleus asticus IPMA8 TaxID=2563858 RepID=A0ABX2D1R5_9CYAN|nr:hypothetical protein [Microcoleus asticus]NQE36595.1 hypothetical protein [Microcoleus asticus IPMA8]
MLFPECLIFSVCTCLSAFCSAVNYAMLGDRQLLDVALFWRGGVRPLFPNGWDRAIIKDFSRQIILGAASI